MSFSFAANTLYWMGVHTSSTATLRTINTTSMLCIGLASSTATTDSTVLRTTPTFGSALATYSYAASQGVSSVIPIVRMQVAV